jgi:hypothetical protein
VLEDLGGWGGCGAAPLHAGGTRPVRASTGLKPLPSSAG